MERKVKFEISEINNFINDDNPEFATATVKFLSTAVNSHKINITEDILRAGASSVLGKPLVGRMNERGDDCEGHEIDEVVFGYFPSNQEIKFEKVGKNLVAIADAVVWKLYATSFYNIFTKKNRRNVSVEMLLDDIVENKDGTTDISAIHITGVTALGKSINGSCPDANMSITKFSEKACEEYYASIWDKLKASEMDKFVKNRKAKFESKSYSINESEIKDTPWGNIDKTELRNKVMEASNRNELVKKVYLQVLDGWEDAPSENLKYPVMELSGNTFYYNKNALASALAYAKQHNEADVISKVEKLYKKFDLAEESEGEDMPENKFENEAWADVVAEIKEHEGDNADVEAVEEDHIIFTVDDVRYRVDADVEIGEDEEPVKADIHWDTKAEMAEEEPSEEEPAQDKEACDTDEEAEETETEEEETSEEEDMEDGECQDDDCDEEDEEKEIIEEASDADKIKELEELLASKEKELEDANAELEELRAFKAEREDAERDAEVQSTLEEIRECVDSETFEALKAEGMQCNLAEIDGWKNKAKSMAWEANKEKKASKTSTWSMSLPTKKTKKSQSVWDRYAK